MKLQKFFAALNVFTFICGIFLSSNLAFAVDPSVRMGKGIFKVTGVTQDTVRTATKTIPNTGGQINLFTKENYKVTLFVPSGSVITQPISIYPLKKNPFLLKKYSFKGTGIFVQPKYTNLSGRYFTKPAWLVFDFKPEGRKYSVDNPFIYCRPELGVFNVAQCLNDREASFEHDKLFAITYNPEELYAVEQAAQDGIIRPSAVYLTPMYALDKDLYAVQVLNSGVYIPRKFSKTEMASFAEVSAGSGESAASYFVEAARGLKYFSLSLGKKLREQLEALDKKQFLIPEDTVNSLIILNAFQVSTPVENIKKKIAFGKFGQNDWGKYFAALGAGKRTKYSDFLPSLFGDDVKNALTKQYAKDNVPQKIKIAVAFYQLLKAKNASIAAAVGFLRWFAPAAFAQTSDWTADIENSIRNDLNTLISQANDFESFLILAGLAQQFGQDDIADSALDKAGNALANDINKASASSGGAATCDLVHKTLKNYAANNCSPAQESLIDLAGKAQAIGRDDLAQEAFSKAGVSF